MNAEAHGGLAAAASSRSSSSATVASSTVAVNQQSSSSKQLPLLQLHLQQLQRNADQVAPLASLDCSITEPMSSGDSHTSVTCTPTLSGYFDCDELSDMVDDSLFEITNAGCLSRSVFGASTSSNSGRQQQERKQHHHHQKQQKQQQKSRSQIQKRQPSDESQLSVTTSIVGPSESRGLSAAAERDQVAGAAGVAVLGVDGDGDGKSGHGGRPCRSSAGREESGREESGELDTPTNEQSRCMASHGGLPDSCSVSGSSSDGSVEPITATPTTKTPPLSLTTTTSPAPTVTMTASTPIGACPAQALTSQVTMLANYKPYDYSSTSSTPAQTRRRSIQKQPPQPAFRVQAQPPPASVGTAQSQQQQQQQRGSARFSGSRSAERAPLPCSPTPTDGGKKKREKRRFTFSLFNLFTSATTSSACSNRSSSSDNNHDDKTTSSSRCCVHTRPSAGPVAVVGGDRHRRRPKISRTGGGGAAIKSRDSIRLANQRKQRNNEQAPNKSNSSNVRLSNSYTDFPSQQGGLELHRQRSATQSAELLLDFSGSSGAHNNNNADRQHSTIGGGGEEQALLSLKSGQSYSSSQGAGGAHNRASSGSAGNLNTTSTNRNNNNKFQQRPTKSVKFTMLDRVMIVPANGSVSSRGSSSNVPPADSLPSAPIIKRPVRKSSSYSQTESSKNLDEMLARYASNEQLILEINEKLKLTETIASPKSALDGAQSCSDGELLIDLDQEDRPSVAAAAATTTNYTTSTNTFNENIDQQQQQQPTLDYQSVANVAGPAALIMLSTAVASNNSANFEANTIAIADADDGDQITTTTFFSAYSDVEDSGGVNLGAANVRGSHSNLSEPNTRRRRISNTSNSDDTQPREERQGSSSSEAEEAGFSKDWLSKQRALV